MYGTVRQRMLAFAMTLGVIGCAPPQAEPTPYLVLAPDGSPASFALITARGSGGEGAVTVWSDESGHFDPSPFPASPYSAEARTSLAEAEPALSFEVTDDDPLPQTLALGAPHPRPNPRGSSFLAQLPDGEEKKELVVDCGGCHIFDSLRMRKDGRDRSEEEWRTALTLMRSLFGPGSGFPIVSDRDVETDVAWLYASLAGQPWPVDTAWPSDLLAGIGRATLTEWDMPEPLDLAHDVAVHPSGEILITGMFTHLVYRFDPTSGAFTTEPIPVENANPRAIDVDPEGRWWLLLGAAGQIAQYDPDAAAWDSWPIGMYPHSIALDAEGHIWYNGHFTHEPELIAELSPATGEAITYEVISDPLPIESTIPYGLRVAADGVVWGTQLRGNRLVRHDPATGDTRVFDMPTTHSGPRRPDVGPDGSIWIPQFGANRIARFDPTTELFEEFELPVEDTAPYVIRVDPVRGTVWIGTGHGDVIAAFDPETERFTAYPLPTRGALIRHLDVDETTGDVWATYSASPGIGGKLVRLRPGAGS